jgi:hypothetical protein
MVLQRPVTIHPITFKIFLSGIGRYHGENTHRSPSVFLRLFIFSEVGDNIRAFAYLSGNQIR